MKNPLFVIDAALEQGDVASEQTAEAAAELTPEQAAQQTLESITDPEAVKEGISELLNYDLTSLLNVVVEGFMGFALKVIAALLIYYVGRWIIGRVMRIMERVYERRNIELTLRSFLSGIVKVLMYVVVVLIVIQVLGINTSSIVAMLASAGLAIGMALSGTLQNFAGGVMLLFLKPYRIGDYIDAQGEEGTVKKIGLFSTEIVTVDNRSIFIPNSTISSAVIDNYSMAEMRRVDWSVSVAYGSDVETVRKALLDIMTADSRVAQDPAPVVFLTELGASTVNFSARAWTKNSDYWGLKFDLNERIYTELPKLGIEFSYPKMDVTIINK